MDVIDIDLSPTFKIRTIIAVILFFEVRYFTFHLLSFAYCSIISCRCKIFIFPGDFAYDMYEVSIIFFKESFGLFDMN